MQENYEYVQKGIRILHPLLAGFVAMEINKKHKGNWWNEVLSVLPERENELPRSGTYAELVDSLDIANALRLIQRKEMEIFRASLGIDGITLSKELMGIRNKVAHIGQQDISRIDAERYIDTMARLCEKIDEEGAKDIRELYNTLRYAGAPAEDDTALSGPMPNEEKLVDDVDMREGVVDDLMTLIRTQKIYKTKITKKITFAGKTELYPVYRVRLDALYYNDQNDRIATWISAYRAENGKDALSSLKSDKYNDVIENFIYESNPESIKKTQKNIALVGQQQPGVILADGRVVDGNRRFTCLRRVQRDTGEKQFFETVIMNVDMNKDRKQIKLLELAIQHGEEKKVDYDSIDYAIGTYRDVVVTGLLTEKEYAEGTNEPGSEVKKRIETARLISDFLEYIKLPGQYHIAKEYQVYGLFTDLIPILAKCSPDEKKSLIFAVFNNILLKAYSDQRKFIRDINTLVKNKYISNYLLEQNELHIKISENFSSILPLSKADLDKFASDNALFVDDINASLERNLLRMRTKNLVNKPSENVAKCKSLLLDIDPRLFYKLDKEEKEALITELERIALMAKDFKEKLLVSE